MQDETLTIFRKFKDAKPPYYNDMIALFPEIKWDRQGLFCTSYMHMGQHGGADYNIVTCGTTKPATPEEYSDLKTELESIGYILKIRRKWIRGNK